MPSEPQQTDRRDFLRTSIAGAAAAALAARAFAQGGPGSVGAPAGAPALAPPATPAAARPLRICHLTDIHVQPERNAEAGLAAALAHAQSQKPDFILTGGDGVMDVFEAKRGRADQLRALLQATFKRECGVPLHHTVGNHDIYGWNKKKSGAAGTESDWGKKFACELYGQPRTYQTFDRGGWRFICLDSVQPKGDGYVGYLDDEQHEWLKSTIAGTPKTTPILIVSHIPILSLTALTYGAPRGREKVGEDTVIHAGEMHTDGTLLHDLFKDAGNVKVCLSGHTHLLDHCMIDGISYICDGAVSGSWWKGPLEGLPEGYGCLELRPDGTFTHEYKTYGWKAAKA
ncbi:MAG: metallophosphoesterase [Phycisphaerales bacterium]